MIQKEIQTNSFTIQNQDEYEKRYSTLCSDFEKIKSKLEKILQTIEDTKARKLKAERFFANLKTISAPLTEFDGTLFERLVDRLIVKSKTDIQIVWKK